MLVARSLGVEGQGIYAAALAFSGLWTTIWTLGVDASHTYLLAGRRRERGEILGATIFWIAAFSLLTTPLYLAIAPWLVGAAGPAATAAIRLSAWAVPLLFAKAFLLSLFAGESRLDRFNALNVLANLFLLALLIAGFAAAGASPTVAVGAYIASLALLTVLASTWVIRQARAERSRATLRSDLLRGSLAYGLAGHVGVLFAQFTYRFDQVLVTRFAGLEALGFYSISVLLAEKLNHVANSVAIALFQRVSASSPQEANLLTPRVCRLVLYLSSLGGAVLFVLSEFLVRLFYSSRFDGAVEPLRILLPGVVALSLSRPLSGDLSGRGRRIGLTAAMGSAFVINLLLGIWWIPRHGIVGAAWASVVAYAWQTIVLSFFFWRESGVSPTRLFWPEAGDFAHLRTLLARVGRRNRG